MKSAIIIPLYNEEKTIAKVISDINDLSLNLDILIVNDKSNDNSLSIINHYKNIILINNKRNVGYEKSLEIGFCKALKLKYNFLITMDADGEHNALDIPKILKLLSEGNNLVVTNREKKNRVSEYFLSFIFNLFFSIKDPLSGYKGYDVKQLIMKNIKIKFSGVGSYILIKSIISSLPIANLNTQTKAREGYSRYGSGLMLEIKIIFFVLSQFLVI